MTMSWTAFRASFSLAALLVRRSRKTRIFALICGLPAAAAVVIEAGRLFFGVAGIDGASI